MLLQATSITIMWDKAKHLKGSFAVKMRKIDYRWLLNKYQDHPMTGSIGRDYKMTFPLLSMSTWRSFAIEND